MGLLSILTGNTKTLNKIVDSSVAGLDALFHTEEEKAKLDQKRRELFYKYLEISASESTAQSVSRRMICLPVVYVWLFLILVNVAASLFFPLVDSAIINETISYMNVPATASISVYVGRHITAHFKGK